MKYSILAFVLSAMAFISCNRLSDYGSIFKNPVLYSKTVYELNTVVMGNNFSPIVASRNYTYANVIRINLIPLADSSKVCHFYRGLKKTNHWMQSLPLYWRFANSANRLLSPQEA
jgi:hypothetical protein